MNNWTLTQLLHSLHDDIQSKLELVQKSLGHPVAKGDASEQVWIELFKTYLPERYSAEKAFIVDSKGAFSQQIDVVIFDRQYSPFIFRFQGATIVPAESVYAVFEAKQKINATQIEYAQKKAESVRILHRTSLPIPHAGGTYPPKPPISILAGILAFESDWNPAFGQPLFDALSVEKNERLLDMGCVAAHGYFKLSKNKKDYEKRLGEKPATAFLFNLISELQFSGTVPMIDIQAYSQWLSL